MGLLLFLNTFYYTYDSLPLTKSKIARENERIYFYLLLSCNALTNTHKDSEKIKIYALLLLFSCKKATKKKTTRKNLVIIVIAVIIIITHTSTPKPTTLNLRLFSVMAFIFWFRWNMFVHLRKSQQQQQNKQTEKIKPKKIRIQQINESPFSPYISKNTIRYVVCFPAYSHRRSFQRGRFILS